MAGVPAVTLDAFLELVRGQVVHELGEDGLSGIHPPLSAIRIACGHPRSGSDAAAANSNRKIASYIYRLYYESVIAISPDLAGHYWF